MSNYGKSKERWNWKIPISQSISGNFIYSLSVGKCESLGHKYEKEQSKPGVEAFAKYKITTCHLSSAFLSHFSVGVIQCIRKGRRELRVGRTQTLLSHNWEVSMFIMYV